MSEGNAMPLSEVADEIGRKTGLRPSRETLARWCRAGVRGSGGQVVRLDAVRVGRRWVATSAAVERFLAALNAS